MSTRTGPAAIWLWEQLLPGGAQWSGVLRRGASLRMTAEADGANVAALLYNPVQPLERFSMADTLMAQHCLQLGCGNVCHSDMGRVLCAITADSCGGHDLLCGLTDTTLLNERRSGQGAAIANDRRSGQPATASRLKGSRDALLVEMMKHDLGERDLCDAINFFSTVTLDAQGQLQFKQDHCRAGAFVDLRFEMDTLLVLHVGPHPLDGRARDVPPGILLQAFRSPPVAVDDRCRGLCPENARASALTEQCYRL